MAVEIEFDRAKREWTLGERRLDLAKAGQIFDGFHMSREDDREEYGEIRVVTLGRMGRKVCLRLDGARRSAAYHLAPRGRTR